MIFRVTAKELPDDGEVVFIKRNDGIVEAVYCEFCSLIGYSGFAVVSSWEDLFTAAKSFEILQSLPEWWIRKSDLLNLLNAGDFRNEKLPDIDQDFRDKFNILNGRLP